MSSSPLTQSAAMPPNLTPRILETRNQYRSCHIRVPGEEQRLAAIAVDNKFYSLLKVVPERSQALKICQILLSKGKSALITCTPKGDAIWVQEPEVILDSRTQAYLQSALKEKKTLPCRILNSSSQYQFCYIRIPDLNDPLEAIWFEGQYYGLFRVTATYQQALEFAVKLKRRGDQPIITSTDEGIRLWVLEPDASLV